MAVVSAKEGWRRETLSFDQIGLLHCQGLHPKKSQFSEWESYKPKRKLNMVWRFLYVAGCHLRMPSVDATGLKLALGPSWRRFLFPRPLIFKNVFLGVLWLVPMTCHRLVRPHNRLWQHFVETLSEEFICATFFSGTNFGKFAERPEFCSPRIRVHGFFLALVWDSLEL